VNNTKIFFLLGSLKLGGTEKVALRVGEYLAGRGVEVWFVSLYSKQDYAIADHRHVVLLEKKQKSFARSAWLAWKNLFLLIRKERPSVVVSFSVGLNLFLFTQLFRRTVFVIDTNIFAFVRKWYFKHLLKFAILFPHVRAVVIPSRGLLDACGKFFFRTKKLVLIGNPVNLEAVDKLKVLPLAEGHLQNSSFIIAAGRINAFKGFVGIVNAYANSSVREKWKLVILGYGHGEAAVRDRIKKLNLEDSVFMLGFKPNPYQYFHKSSLFLLNSKFESFGNVLIEALSCDVPVLSSDCDFGPRDIITRGVNGDLFQFNDEGEITRKLELLLSDNEAYLGFRRSARPSILRFDINIVGAQWEDMLLKVAKDSNSIV